MVMVQIHLGTAAQALSIIASLTFTIRLVTSKEDMSS